MHMTDCERWSLGDATMTVRFDETNSARVSAETMRGLLTAGGWAEVLADHATQRDSQKNYSPDQYPE